MCLWPMGLAFDTPSFVLGNRIDAYASIASMSFSKSLGSATGA